MDGTSRSPLFPFVVIVVDFFAGWCWCLGSGYLPSFAAEDWMLSAPAQRSAGTWASGVRGWVFTRTLGVTHWSGVGGTSVSPLPAATTLPLSTVTSLEEGTLSRGVAWHG